jgi:hypothetical protein
MPVRTIVVLASLIFLVAIGVGMVWSRADRPEGVPAATEHLP